MQSLVKNDLSNRHKDRSEYLNHAHESDGPYAIRGRFRQFGGGHPRPKKADTLNFIIEAFWPTHAETARPRENDQKRYCQMDDK